MAVPIPQPWGAITRSGLVCTLLPRKTFDFSHAPFADQFTINGQNILASPITLKVKNNIGSATLQTISAVPTISTEEAGQVVYTWTWTGSDSISASGTITVEADGVCKYDFTINRLASQRIAQLELVIPLASGIVEHLLGYPRGLPDEIESWKPPENSLLWDYADGVYTHTWESGGQYFPRVLCVHNGEYGFEFMMESDYNFGMTGYSGSTATVVVDTTDDTVTYNIINGNFPLTGTTSLSYTFWMTPLPTKDLADTGHLGRIGDVLDTPASALVRPLAEEGASSWAKWFGAFVKREGTWGTPDTGFDAKRLARLERGLADAFYTSIFWWPSTHPDYQSAWSNPLVGGIDNDYLENGVDEGTDYVLDYIDPALSGFDDFFLAEAEEAFEYTDGLYFDGHNPTITSVLTDAGSVGRYRYPLAIKRTLMRRVAMLCQANGKKMVVHPQCDFCVASGDHFADWTVPGEQWTGAISDISDGNDRRRFYLDTITQTQWKGQFPVRVFATHHVLLPEWRTPDVSEAFATESSLAASALHNLGYWHSFSFKTTVESYFQALDAFGMEDGATFYGYWYSDTPATTADENAKVSCWVKGTAILVAVVNFTDTDRAIDFTVDGVTFGETVYAGGSASTEESRTAYSDAGDLTGSGGSFTVNVARKNMALVQFARAGTLPSPQFGRADSRTTTGFGRPKIADDVFTRS